MELRLRSLDGGFLWLTSVCAAAQPTVSSRVGPRQTYRDALVVSWRVAALPPPRFGWRSVPWALDEETSERPSAAKRLCERCGGTVRDGLADLFPVVRCHCSSLATWSPAQSVCRERQPETIPPSRERSVKAATHSQKPRVLAAASPPAELSARGNVHRPPFGQFPG